MTEIEMEIEDHNPNTHLFMKLLFDISNSHIRIKRESSQNLVTI